MCKALGCLWLVWVLLSGCPAVAGVLDLAPGQGRLVLHDVAEVLEDPGGLLTLDAVRGGQAGAAFAPAPRGLTSFGFTASAYWFRFTLRNPGPDALQRLLVLRTSWLDTVDLYRPGPGGAYTAWRGGDTLPFDERAYDTPQFLIDLAVAPGQHTYYLRLTTSQAFVTPMELWELRAFVNNDRLWSAYYGMFYGILAAMVLYNAFIWTSTRDSSHLALGVYLLAFLLMNASYSGYAFQYFWPDSPRWNNWAYTPFIFLSQVTSLWFSMCFLESRTRLPRLHQVLQVFLGVLLACWVGVALIGDSVAYNAAPVWFVFADVLLILAAGLRAWLRGYRAARFFVLATMASLIGGFVTALTVSGLLPYSFAHFHAAEFGILASVVLLSLALADRIKMLQLQRRAAQLQSARQRLQTAMQLEKANLHLEHLVHERTAELARARDEAEQLARLDVLTGVANLRQFQEAAEREAQRARRDGHALAVLVFDIDLFKQINDRHGHAAGDEVLRAVAQTVQGAVRESDLVARIGGEEFAVLLPEVSAAEALVTAEGLRERIAAWSDQSDSRALRCTASFGISALNGADAGFDAMLQRADQAMYQAKQAGRNQVRVAGGGAARPALAS